MYDFMLECNSKRLNKVALNYFGHKITHAELKNNIDKCAVSLNGIGVKKGDIVSLCLLNMPETVYLLYAINKIGAIANFIGCNATDVEIKKSIANTESKIIFVADVVQNKVVNACGDEKELKIFVIPVSFSLPKVPSLFYKLKSSRCSETISWNEFLHITSNGNDVCFEIVGADDPAIIEYTGGTTGQPKGVLLSNKAANAIAFQYIGGDKMFDIKPGEKFMNIIPPFLAYGIFFGTHTALCCGLENILCPDSDPIKFPKLFAKYRPNHFSGGILHIDNLIKNKKVNKMNLSFVKTAAYGGDGMNEIWEESVSGFLKSHGSKHGVLKGYGMTETASTVCTATHRSNEMIPMFLNNFKIVDTETGEELPYNQSGEILISGPSLMMQYFKNNKLTDETIFVEEDGRWIHTGDLGYITQNGELNLVGRIKRILWSVGEDNIPYRVYPMEVESVICRCEAVEKCAVVGLENGERGYLLVAFIVLKCGTEFSETIRNKIVDLCRENLHQNAVPYKYNFVKELPVTKAGKLDYKNLEKQLIQNIKGKGNVF